MLDSPKEKAFNRTTPGRAREGRSPLELPIKRISRREIVSASYRGWQWRGSLLPPPHPLYAHHISPLLSKIITSFSMAIAFSSPSVGVIRLSSCSMEIIPS